MGTKESSLTTTTISLTTPLQEVFDLYLDENASGTPHTLRAKRLDLGHLLSFLKRRSGDEEEYVPLLKEWNVEVTKEFYDERVAKKEAPATVARRIATLRHLSRWLEQRVPAFPSPTEDIAPPTVNRRPPPALDIPEIEAARERARERYLEKSSFIRHRNEMLLTLLVATGLRPDEVRLLKRGQLSEDLTKIKGVKTKGSKVRDIAVPEDLHRELKVYLDARFKQLMRFFTSLPGHRDEELPLFISTYNADTAKIESFSMGAKSIWRAIHELSGDTELHPHLLRHSFAKKLLTSSKDPILVAKVLGHSDLRVTRKYQG